MRLRRAQVSPWIPHWNQIKIPEWQLQFPVSEPDLGRIWRLGLVWEVTVPQTTPKLLSRSDQLLVRPMEVALTAAYLLQQVEVTQNLQGKCLEWAPLHLNSPPRPVWVATIDTLTPNSRFNSKWITIEMKLQRLHLLLHLVSKWALHLSKINFSHTTQGPHKRVQLPPRHTLNLQWLISQASARPPQNLAVKSQWMPQLLQVILLLVLDLHFT